MDQTPVIPPYLRRQGEFDPDPSLAEARDAGLPRLVTTPFGMDAWLLTRLADVREVLGDARRFSNVLPPERLRHVLGEDVDDAEVERMRAGNLLAFDPPDHTRLRRMLTPAFTVRQMHRLEPRITKIVDDHLDAMEAAGPPVDLVPAFALPVPSLVICELLGVPYADREEFQQRTKYMVDLTLPPKVRMSHVRASREYMRSLVTRERADPGEGMLGSLVRLHGDDLGTDELVGIGNLLLIAGHETTANMLALGTLALLRHPDQLQLVRDRPDLAEAAVEELLRWLTIVSTGPVRRATEPVEIGGRAIAAGELVLASLPAVDRDPALLSDPDVLDVTRGAMGHLAFGHGVHHCLGAPLARTEMRVAFPALLRRFPGLRLAGGPDDLEVRRFSSIHGVVRLPVAW